MKQTLLEKEKEVLISQKLKTMVRTTWTPNDVVVYSNHAEIYLRNKKQELVGISIIDKEDIDLIKRFKWHLTTRGYCSSHNGQQENKLHRLIIGAKKGQIVDHINKNKLNNKKENLRIVNDSTSLRNRERKQIVPVFAE